MSDSEDQSKSSQSIDKLHWNLGNEIPNDMASRKKKTHRRKLESDDEEEVVKADDGSAVGDLKEDEELDDDQKQIQGLSVEELEKQIKEAEAQLAGKKLPETGGRKREGKAASKAAAAAEKAKN